MAELKSYSCPKCGSFLEVDRDKDVFDCPFCGNHFTAIDFHKEELLDEARLLVFEGQKSKALEKYEYLLSIDPDDFDLLYEYACVVDGIGALKDRSINTADPLNRHEKLRILLKNDPRFMQGEWADYYKKLYELVQLSNEYHEVASDHRAITRAAKNVINEKLEKRHYGIPFIVSCIAIVGFFIAVISSSKQVYHYSNSDIRVYIPLIVYFSILAFVIAFMAFINMQEQKEFKTAKKRQQKQYDELNERAEKLYADEVEPAYEKYMKAAKELEELRPEVLKKIESKKLKLLKQMADKKPDKATSVSFVKPVPVIKNEVCAKCGGDLTLDNENKLYVCTHCGVSYDYSTFVGTPGSKAKREIMNGEFDLAEKRYVSILENDPGNFEANRGLVLCAGKWRGLPDLRLNNNLKNVDWVKLDERIKAAKENSSHFNHEYFLAFEQLIECARHYREASHMTDADRIAVMRAAEQSFKFRYKNFVPMDKKYQMAYQDKTDFELLSEKTRHNLRISLDLKDFVVADKGYVRMLMYYPDDVESLRARILCAGKWRNPEEISLTRKLSHGFLDRLDSRIQVAKDSASSEYSEYFETFGSLVDLMRTYYVCSPVDKEPDKLKKLQSEFDELRTSLIEMDKKLFDFS